LLLLLLLLIQLRLLRTQHFLIQRLGLTGVAARRRQGISGGVAAAAIVS